jgi:hypothetical protein
LEDKTMNKCSGCGKDFRSGGAFEMHRIGKFEPKPGQEGRRCMTTDEMIAAGMQQDGKGTWRGPANPYFQKKTAKEMSDE